MPKEYESREANQSKNTESSNHFLLGAIIGGLAGAAVALVLAPKSGKDFRSSINSQAGSLLEKTSQLRENVSNKGGSLVSKTQGMVQQASSKVKMKTGTEREEESKIDYIPIGSIEHKETKGITLGQDEIRRKIQEAEQALEEEENKVKH